MQFILKKKKKKRNNEKLITVAGHILHRSKEDATGQKKKNIEGKKKGKKTKHPIFDRSIDSIEITRNRNRKGNFS